jgi:quinol monooxygenase YgiN
MKRFLSLLFMAGLSLGAGGFALAQDDANSVVVIVHVDVMPPFTTQAADLLAQLQRDSRHEAGEKDFEVLQEIGRPNHFTLVEAWVDQAAFDAHNAAAHTRHFRDQLQPMLGSPFDERLHHPLAKP